MSAPRSFEDLLPSERSLVRAMQQLGFGRLERMQIHMGEPVVDPWPRAVRAVKFCSDDRRTGQTRVEDFELKRQVVDLIEYIRSTSSGEISSLEIKHGLPFSMEFEVWHSPERRSL